MPIQPDLFENPPKQYRPWTVWWWFGGASSAEDLIWELQQMDAHGIGGVEINPVYALNEAGAAGPEVYSDTWQQHFLAVVGEAERLGIKVWLRAGSGWPVGGPWITPDLASQSVAHAVVEARGPSSWSGSLPPPAAPKHWSNPVLECVVGVNADSGERRVLEAFSRPSDSVSISVPAGNWNLYFIYHMSTNMKVKRPSPGGAGFVLNHYDTEALDAQLAVLNRFAARARQVAPNAFMGIAEDSLELDDDNWTHDFLSEFQRRRGYDLRPYLPDLWEDSPASPGIRHDFLLTVSDLMLERHFEHLRNWASRHGMKTIVEAHGSMTDIMRAYASTDIPDGETIWANKEQQEVNIRNRRVASSAAHVYGKPLASAESFTWLRMPRFLVKPWMVKGATDAIFLDGINQIRNHGYSSSPRSMGAPGQVFYASTLLNHNQTWWPHYPAISRYTARMQYLLQQGEPANDVWIYHNLWDGMADYRKPTPEWMTGNNAWRHPETNPGIDGAAQIAMRTHDVAEALRKGGYGFDYINDHALATRIPERPTSADLRGIRALVMQQTRFVPTATLRKLLALTAAGLHIISVGNLPEAGVGYVEQHEGKQAWQEAFDALWRTGKWSVVSDPFAMTLWLNFRPKPDFEPDAAGSTLGFIHRREGDTHYYFVSNGSDNPVTSTVKLRLAAQTMERWDALTGTRSAQPCKADDDGRTETLLQLGPWESCILVVGHSQQNTLPQSTPLAFVEGTQHLSLENWSLGRDGEDILSPLPNGPVDWETLPSWRNYAGIGIYRASVTIPQGLGGSRFVLELGNVEVSAEIRVDGRLAGYVILPPWRIDVTEHLNPGHNSIEIRVANLWSNAVKAMPPAPGKIPGPGYGITDILYGPTERPDQSSGLLGPVRLLVAR